MKKNLNKLLHYYTIFTLFLACFSVIFVGTCACCYFRCKQTSATMKTMNTSTWCHRKKVLTVMVNNYTNINKANNHLSAEAMEHKKITTYGLGNPSSDLYKAHICGMAKPGFLLNLI